MQSIVLLLTIFRLRACCLIKKNIVFYENKKLYRKLLSGTFIIVIRIATDKLIRNSKPCVDCANLLKSCGIRKVIYSNPDGTYTVEKMNRFVSEHVSSSSREIDQAVYKPPLRVI